ncbi:MAG: hypothetical protein ACOYB1_20655 [Limnohabitans sp.]
MPLTNPYPSGTDNHVDFEIWNNGVERFNDPARKYSRHTGQPHELDYLRGFHDPGTLAAIKARIAAVTGQTVNVTSFWLDKTAYVIPTTPGVSTKKRELADLAIVLRDYARRDHVMWILQAKKGDSAAARLATGGSTPKEIELFEKAPQFELEPLSKSKTNLTFNLEPEFGPPANSVNFRHWSFLMFRETPTAPAASGPSPAQWRWNGSGQNPQTGSFMKGITEMLLSPMDPDHKGAKLLPGMPTGWKGLHDALMNHVPSGAFLGHAGRPMRITAFSTPAPLHWQIGIWPTNVISSPLFRFVVFSDGVAHLWPPAIKFDMISTGPDEGQELQDWKMEMSNNDFWRGVEQDISTSIDRAIDSEISDEAPPRDSDADFAGGGRRPPGEDAGDEDGNGAHPARATLVIDIRSPRSV